ncbi:MAG: hypothetical protein ACE5GF_00635 [Thermodesulfobacteriota bacterium]
MRRLPKKYLTPLLLIAFYLFSVKGVLGMPLLATLLDGNHRMSLTSSHGKIHISKYHTESHETHTHHDNDFSDIHPGFVDTGHEHSEHESHLTDYTKDAFANINTVGSLKVSHPLDISCTIPVINIYRYGASHLKTPPPLDLSLTHISTTILLI